MRIFASLLVAFSIFLFFSREASADPPAPVVVVDIKGDIEDPEGLRAAIARELRADAVTPDDPRAGGARGTLTIEARGEDRRISATYRSLGTPVARTVDLPSDPKRARSVAVLLAGNVAREEANELLNGLEKPAPGTQVTAARADEEQLARLRAVLKELSAGDVDRRKWVGVASLIEGGLSLGAGTYYLTRGGDRFQYTRSAGLYLLIHGAISGGIGALLLAGPNASYEMLAVELEEKAATGTPGDAVKAIESRWAAQAASARSIRKFAGWVGILAGTFGAGVGLALPALVPPGQQDGVVPLATITMVGLSGMLVAVGIDSLFTQTSIEQSWATYRVMKATAAPGPSARTAPVRPTASLAPLPGGAMATLGFTF